MSWNQGRLYHINDKEPMLQVWQMKIQIKIVLGAFKTIFSFKFLNQNIEIYETYNMQKTEAVLIMPQCVLNVRFTQQTML